MHVCTLQKIITCDTINKNIESVPFGRPHDKKIDKAWVQRDLIR